MDVLVRPETGSDASGIAHVHRLAFGQEDEARLAVALRRDGSVVLSLVAEAAEQVVGHVLFSRLLILGDREVVEGLALAPLAVLPDRQRRGIGSALVREGLSLALASGERIVIVLGDPAYYGRFGFSAAVVQRLESEYAGEHFQGLELAPRALVGLRGRVRYPAAFAAL